MVRLTPDTTYGLMVRLTPDTTYGPRTAVVRSVRLQADAWSRENDCRETCTRAKSQRHRDYLGCVTTSTSAGSPRLTTAMARLSAGARSAGFSIGPSACTPSPCAIFA